MPGTGMLGGHFIDHQLHWTIYDGLAHRKHPEAERLAVIISDLSGSTHHSVRYNRLHDQLDDYSCGTIALVHLSSFLQVPIRARTWATSAHPPSGALSSALGHHFTTLQLLAAILQEWGVPLKAVAGRAQL